MPARFEIAKVGPKKYEVRLGILGWKKGEPFLSYRLAVVAEDVENIDMENWEDRRVEDGKVIIPAEGVAGFPYDILGATGLKSVRCSVLTEISEVPSFNVTYIDETVEEPKRKTLASMQKDYTWYSSFWHRPYVKEGTAMVGIAIATGFAGRWLGWW